MILKEYSAFVDANEISHGKFLRSTGSAYEKSKGYNAVCPPFIVEDRNNNTLTMLGLFFLVQEVDSSMLLFCHPAWNPPYSVFISCLLIYQCVQPNFSPKSFALGLISPPESHIIHRPRVRLGLEPLL